MEEKPEENNSNFIGMENGIFIVGIPRPQHALKQYWIRSKTELLAGIANSFPSNYIIHTYTLIVCEMCLWLLLVSIGFISSCVGAYTRKIHFTLYTSIEKVFDFKCFFLVFTLIHGGFFLSFFLWTLLYKKQKHKSTMGKGIKSDFICRRFFFYALYIDICSGGNQLYWIDTLSIQ